VRAISIVLVGLAVALAVAAAPPYRPTPDWISGDTQVSTGAALADLNRDGWLDLVVANGNDMAEQRIVVYYNKGDGTFPALPNWQSADIAYHGHLDVADVNGDGWIDVGVATLGNGSKFGPVAKVYLNNSGTLSSLPNWKSAEIAPAFGIAFGDVNNDGRPDIAVATGWSYGTPHQYYNYVYVNQNGTYAPDASWRSDDKWDYQGALWVDADGDGWLDLAEVGTRVNTKIYRNLGGTLETTASWETKDAGNQDAIMACAGDVTGDGYRELFVADNSQLGGSGRFRQYNGLPGGFFSTAYNWSYLDGYCSAVALADLNADGKLDLATGAWWDNTRVFLNAGTGLPTVPDWSSGGTSVVEKIAFGDIDKNAVYTTGAAFNAPGQHLFYLAKRPIQRLLAVRRNGVPLAPSQYTYSSEHGWITVAPSDGVVEVEYRVSSRLDMAVTNWDNTKGNYVYYNILIKKGDANCDGVLNNFDIDPFVLILTDPQTYKTLFPDCDGLKFCDMNGDGVVNNFDIDPFVYALSNP